MSHKVGDYIARIAYFKVCTPPLKLAVGDMHIRNLRTGLEFDVQGEQLIGEYISASEFKRTERVTRTELAHRFIQAGQLPFTVCFRKSDGELRTLVGHLVSHEDLMGRSMVYDFEVTQGNPLRSVDHRGLEWLVCNGIKSALKVK